VALCEVGRDIGAAELACLSDDLEVSVSSDLAFSTVMNALVADLLHGVGEELAISAIRRLEEMVPTWAIPHPHSSDLSGVLTRSAETTAATARSSALHDPSRFMPAETTWRFAHKWLRPAGRRWWAIAGRIGRLGKRLRASILRASFSNLSSKLDFLGDGGRRPGDAGGANDLSSTTLRPLGRASLDRGC